jgi:hypothetical protein
VIGQEARHLEPGGEENYAAFFRYADAFPGKALYFGVRLMLSDSTMIEWTGPPGSERPALRVEAVAPTPNRFVVPAAITLALLCMGILLVAGVWKARLHLRYRTPNSR